VSQNSPIGEAGVIGYNTMISDNGVGYRGDRLVASIVSERRSPAPLMPFSSVPMFADQAVTMNAGRLKPKTACRRCGG
jgi:hypothetical protein